MPRFTDIIYTVVTSIDSILLVIYVTLLAIIIKNRRAPEFSSSYFKILISLGFADVWMIIHKYYIHFIPYYFFYRQTIDSQVEFLYIF